MALKSRAIQSGTEYEISPVKTKKTDSLTVKTADSMVKIAN